MNDVVMLFLYSLGLSLTLSIIYRVFTKPSEIRRIREDLKMYNKKMKEAQKAGKEEEMKKYLDMSMKANQEQMKQNMKPMLISMMLFFILLSFISNSEIVVNLPVSLPILSWAFPFISFTMKYNWFWWYLVITVPFTFTFRKLLGVE